MKKYLLLLIVSFLIIDIPVHAQLGRALNKVSQAISGDKSPKANTDPEPKSACSNPEKVVDLGGKLKLMYSEISVSMSDDGELLLKDRISGDFYIVKDGNPQGPVKAGDPRLGKFNKSDDDEEGTGQKPVWTNNPYITKSGEKYTIKFGGKTYGPFSEIQQFKVSGSKDKFAAVIVENSANSEADLKKMEAAIKNAKTDQERMELSMQFSQQMAQNMQKAGGIEGTMPKLLTNIAGATFDPLHTPGQLNSSLKYDDILINSYNKIIDLTGKTLITIKPEAGASKYLFLNSQNTKYAYYNYGTLTFSDGTSIPDLFNAHMVKANGASNIAYMYYSPKTNAIMQCKIPF